ncbi:MAG: glutamate-cysteine ligase family protein [Myxococcota bacterium]
MSKQPELTQEQILATFHTYGAPRGRWLVGGEFERPVVRPDGRPVFYDDEDGIRWILERLAERYNWTLHREGDTPIALFRDKANVTLEPGGQLELSGAPHASLKALSDEAYRQRDEIRSIIADRPLTLLATGLTPFARIEDIGWMPKGRYQIMQQYLPGELAHYMMKGTASVQCNYDYADEADCARKVRLSAGLAPLTTAMFANSPMYAGQLTGYQSYRGYIWTKTDPDRTGFPPGLRDDYSHERWVDYLLDVPMMFYKSGEVWLPAEGRSFRSFMQAGIAGQRPSVADWDLHMTSVFPEVRIKRTIEVRGADCVPLPLAVAFCALFTGLFYDEGALDEGLAIVDDFMKHADREARFLAACQRGLQAEVGGQRLHHWAQSVVTAARKGLTRVDPGAAAMLDPLEENVRAGRTPADGVIDAWEAAPDPRALIDYLQY